MSRATPFLSAEHFIAWQERNCCRCKHYVPSEDERPSCEAQLAAETCCLNPEAGKRLLALAGHGKSPDLVAGVCKLREWNDETKARNSALRTLPLFG